MACYRNAFLDTKKANRINNLQKIYKKYYKKSRKQKFCIIFHLNFSQKFFPKNSQKEFPTNKK